MLKTPTHTKKTLSKEERDRFLSLTPEDITLEFLQKTFADTYSVEKKEIVPSPYNTFDEFELAKGEYLNCDRCTTNLGLFVFNKVVLEKTFGPRMGYVNYTINKKGYGKLQTTIADIIMEDPNEEEVCNTFTEYSNRLVWLAFTFHTEICASLNVKISKPSKKVMAEKKRLMKEHKKDFDECNITTIVKVQNQLVDMAKKEMEDDPSYELYASGARGAFDNAYRQAQIMKGPVYNAGEGKWELIENSLYEGYNKKDIALLADSIVDGCYSKSISTGECGYLTKKIAAGFQADMIDEPGTDCKTKDRVEVKLTDDIYGMYEFHYVDDGGKLVRLDKDSKSKYINKTVKMRLPSNCCGDILCSKCAGDRYYMLNIREIGLTHNRIANSLLRGRMKAAHDATVRLWNLSLDEAVV